MNETDVRDLFAAAVAHPDVDRIDTDAVLRGGRRRRRVRTAATVGSALAVVAAAGAVALAARPHPAPDPFAAPSTLTVACSPTGLTVSGDVVAATPAGVVVSVSSTMPPGASLSVRWTGVEATYGLTGDPARRTLQAPPGPLTLSCSGLRGAVPVGGSRTVTVTDPHRYWSPATLADRGCSPGLHTMPAYPSGSGATPEAAVSDYLVRRMPSRTVRDVSVAEVRMGYPDAPDQVWLVSVHGVPVLSLRVHRAGATYTANHYQACASATSTPSSTA